MKTRKNKHKNKIIPKEVFSASNTPYTVSRNINGKVYAIMRGGMNKYGFINNLNQYSNTNLNLPSNNNGIYNEEVAYIEPPWIIQEYQTVNYEYNGKRYSFELNEQYEASGNTWYLYLRIGSKTTPNCVVAILDSDTNFERATIQELKYSNTCSICHTLPPKGVGARILMYVTTKYLTSKGITSYILSDMASNKCNGQQYAISDLYFLAHGETYYHKFGFLPSRHTDVYVKLVLFMKSVSWNDFRAISKDSDYMEVIKQMEGFVSNTLLPTDKATKWFQTVWASNCEVLVQYAPILFNAIGKYLKITLQTPYIPKLWMSFEQRNDNEIHEIYNELLTDAEKRNFYMSVRPLNT